MDKTTLIILAGAGIALYLAHKSASSVRRRFDHLVDETDHVQTNARHSAKQLAQDIHDGIDEYFAENWPKTNSFYNWWSQPWWGE